MFFVRHKGTSKLIQPKTFRFAGCWLQLDLSNWWYRVMTEMQCTWFELLMDSLYNHWAVDVCFMRCCTIKISNIIRKTMSVKSTLEIELHTYIMYTDSNTNLCVVHSECLSRMKQKKLNWNSNFCDRLNDARNISTVTRSR